MKVEQVQQKLVAKLAKAGEDIIATLSPEKAHLWHMASKLCSEAGELMDAFGKLVIYNKELDIENVIEELGDMEFYMEGIRSTLRIEREQTLLSNIIKLQKRYPGISYSDEAAQARADKA